MTEITTEKLQKLGSNPGFSAKMSGAASMQEVLNVFAEYGIELTEEEYNACCL